MDELAALAELARIWLEGGSWEKIQAAEGFRVLAFGAAALVPSSLILIGIGGLEEWRQTPLAMWFGARRDDPEASWSERARDLDGDGWPDF